MFIKIQLFSFHSYCHALAAARFISILLSHFYIFTYPSTTSLCLVLFFYTSLFDQPKLLLLLSKVLHIIFRCSTTATSQDFLIPLLLFFLFLLDVNFTYSISIFCSTDNIFIFLCNLHTVAVAIYKIIRGREKEQWKIIKICGYISLDWDEKKNTFPICDQRFLVTRLAFLLAFFRSVRAFNKLAFTIICMLIFASFCSFLYFHYYNVHHQLSTIFIKQSSFYDHLK